MVRLWVLAMAGCGRVAFDHGPRSDAQPIDMVDAEDPIRDASTVCGALPFNDGFDDGVPGPAWAKFSNAGVTVVETNSALTISLSGIDDTFGWYTSTCTADHRNRRASTRIAGLLNAVPSVQMWLMIRIDLQNTIGIQYQNDEIVAFDRVADLYGEHEKRPYDAVAYRYWRVGGDNGDAVWDVSSNGVDWVELHRMPSPIDLSATELMLSAGQYNPGANPGTAAFAELAVR